jgi:hypothetical protein
VSETSGNGRSRRRFLGDLGLSAAAAIVAPGRGSELGAEALVETQGEATEQATLDGSLAKSSYRRQEIDCRASGAFRLMVALKERKWASSLQIFRQFVGEKSRFPAPSMIALQDCTSIEELAGMLASSSPPHRYADGG